MIKVCVHVFSQCLSLCICLNLWDIYFLSCIEHNIVMDVIIKTARLSKKTLQTTWFDLEYATVGGERPFFGQYWEREESEFNLSIKEQVKTSGTVRSEEQHAEYVITLVRQGEFLKLAESKHGDAVWKPFIQKEP